jgi:hypothetical protein
VSPTSLDFVYAINDRDQLVGVHQSPHGEPVAAGQGISIQAAPAPVSLEASSSDATVLNNRGQTAGLSTGRLNTGPLGQLYFDQDGLPPIALAAAVGADGRYTAAPGNSVCNHPSVGGINDDGVLAVLESTTHAVYLWRDSRTTRIALSASPWQIDAIHAIDNHGLIIGRATNTTTGAQSAIVLTPQ